MPGVVPAARAWPCHVGAVIFAAGNVQGIGAHYGHVDAEIVNPRQGDLSREVGALRRQGPSVDDHLDAIAAEKLHGHTEIVGEHAKVQAGRHNTRHMHGRCAGVEIDAVAGLQHAHRGRGDGEFLLAMLLILLRKRQFADERRL